MQKFRSQVRKKLSYYFPDRERGLKAEVTFWNEWLDSEALGNPDDYDYRLDPVAPLRGFPADLVEKLSTETHPGNAQISILDVGAGPLTTIGKTYQGKHINLSAVDTLADEYAVLLTKRNIIPPVATIQCSGDELVKYFKTDRFHLVYAENSLDHAEDPLFIIQQMVSVCLPGGIVGLLHRHKEGDQQNYRDLHHWNFYVQQSELMISGRKYTRRVNQSLGDFGFTSEVKNGMVYSWGKKDHLLSSW
jgi:SAM-dependent methyltransferase